MPKSPVRPPFLMVRIDQARLVEALCDPICSQGVELDELVNQLLKREIEIIEGGE
jgi:hypothetical protein